MNSPEFESGAFRVTGTRVTRGECQSRLLRCRNRATDDHRFVGKLLFESAHLRHSFSDSAVSDDGHASLHETRSAV